MSEKKEKSRSKKGSLSRLEQASLALQKRYADKKTTPGEDESTEELRLAKQKAMHVYSKELEQVAEGSLELPGFLKAIAPRMTQKILEVLETTKDEKLVTRLAQDLLDRAGYGKIQKGAIMHGGTVDVNTTKLELVNMVMSLGRKAGVNVEQESYVDGQVEETSEEAVTGE